MGEQKGSRIIKERTRRLGLTDLFAIFTSHRPFLLHDGLLLKFTVIGNVRDNFAVLLDSQCLWIVRNLGELAFRLLEFGVVFHVALNLRVLRDAFQFRRLGHCGGFRLWYVPVETEEARSSSIDTRLRSIPYRFNGQRFIDSWNILKLDISVDESCSRRNYGNRGE